MESLKYHKANLFASDGAGKTAIEVFKQTTDCDREVAAVVRIKMYHSNHFA